MGQDVGGDEIRHRIGKELLEPFEDKQKVML